MFKKQQEIHQQPQLTSISYEQQAANLSFLMLSDLTLEDITAAMQYQQSSTIEQNQQQQYLQQLSFHKSRLNISSHEKSQQEMQDQMENFMLIENVKQIYQRVGNQLKSIDVGNLWKKNQDYVKFYVILAKTIQSSLKVNKIRQMQMKSLSDLVDNAGMINKKTYEKRYNRIGQFSVPYPTANKGKPNMKMAQKVLKTQIPLLEKQQQIIQFLQQQIRSKRYLQDLSQLIRTQQKLNIINSKLLTISEVFPYSCVVPFNDLLCLPDDHQRRKFVSKYTTIQKYGTRQEIRQSFIKVKEGMNVVNSIMGVLENDAGGNKGSVKQILKCLIFKQIAHHQSEHMMADPSAQVPKNIWNLTDKKLLKPFVKIGALPSIQVSQKIYIPRIMRQVFKTKGKAKLPDNIFIEDCEQYYNNLLQKKQYKDGVLLRLNCPFQIQPSFEPKKSNLQKIDKLVIHFHGSGFIGFSTFIHQAYVRNWAKSLNVPIISVDYGKAPQNPFPCAIQDCFQAIIWAAFCFSQVYHANPTKIIVIGDSSGGNLAAVLNNILIQWQIYRLAGVICVYPALNLNFKSFTPSLLSSLNDMILPHTFLKICLKCYLQDPELKPQQNSLLSPLLVSDQTIKKYPPVQIFIGDVDAFHDDALRLVEKINKIFPGKCRLTVFQQFPHGFIMFDMKLQAHQPCEKATKKVQQALRRLLNS